MWRGGREAIQAGQVWRTITPLWAVCPMGCSPSSARLLHTDTTSSRSCQPVLQARDNGEGVGRILGVAGYFPYCKKRGHMKLGEWGKGFWERGCRLKRFSLKRHFAAQSVWLCHKLSPLISSPLWNILSIFPAVAAWVVWCPAGKWRAVVCSGVIHSKNNTPTHTYTHALLHAVNAKKKNKNPVTLSCTYCSLCFW